MWGKPEIINMTGQKIAILVINVGKTRENQHDLSQDCTKCSKCDKRSLIKHEWKGL